MGRAETHLAGGEHALDRHAHRDDAEDGGPLAPEDRRAYLRGTRITVRECYNVVRSGARGAYMAVRVDVLGGTREGDGGQMGGARDGGQGVWVWNGRWTYGVYGRGVPVVDDELDGGRGDRVLVIEAELEGELLSLHAYRRMGLERSAQRMRDWCNRTS